MTLHMCVMSYTKLKSGEKKAFTAEFLKQQNFSVIPFALLQEEYLSRCFGQLNFKFRLNGLFSPRVS